MHAIDPTDPGRAIDWGRTSEDYAKFRPGPPEDLYTVLAALGIGLPGQEILDLGTGTGVHARMFARRGARVSGTDISDGQIETARELARRDGVEVTFRVAPAEANPFANHRFDVVTANQCWLYFDLAQVIPEVRRLLRPTGRLVTSHFSWLPRVDAIAQRTEQLILRFNPQWTAADWDGEVPVRPAWSRRDFGVRAMVCYDVLVPFTRDSWRGRIRASRGVGATLAPDEVARFDRALDAILREIAPATFTVAHRVDAHVFEPR